MARSLSVAATAARLAERIPVLSRVSARYPQATFLTPIRDVLSGVTVDRTSRATRRYFVAFAFPLLRGLDFLTPNMDRIDFDPTDHDSMDAAIRQVKRKLLPKLATRQTLDDLMRHSQPLVRNPYMARDEHGIDIGRNLFSNGQSGNAERHCFLLVACGRAVEAGRIIEEFLEQRRALGSRDVVYDDLEELRWIQRELVSGDDARRARRFAERRERTLEALRIDRSALAG